MLKKRKGIAFSALLAPAFVLAVILIMEIAFIVFFKINIRGTQVTTYNHANANLLLVELMSYSDVSGDMILYASGMEDGLDRGEFEERVGDILDGLVQTDCYKLLRFDGSEPIEIARNTLNVAEDGELCKTKYYADAVVVAPYGHEPVKIALEI